MIFVKSLQFQNDRQQLSSYKEAKTSMCSFHHLNERLCVFLTALQIMLHTKVDPCEVASLPSGASPGGG